jgi:hypothetical protein
VSDITAAVISAAVKAVVRNSFMSPSYEHCPPNGSALCGTIHGEHRSGPWRAAPTQFSGGPDEPGTASSGQAQNWIAERSRRGVGIDHNGQALAYVYFEQEPGGRSAAELLERDEARRKKALTLLRRNLIAA